MVCICVTSEFYCCLKLGHLITSFVHLRECCFLNLSNGAYLVGLAKERVSSTALVDHISDQVFLSVVGGEDADAVSRVAQQTHVHVQSHRVLCLCQVLHRGR